MIEEEAAPRHIEQVYQRGQHRNLQDDQALRKLLGFRVVEFFISIELGLPRRDFLLHQAARPRSGQHATGCLHAQVAVEGVDIAQRLHEKVNHVGDHEERERIGEKFFASGEMFARERARFEEEMFKRLEKFAVEMRNGVQQLFRKVAEGMIVRVKGFLAAIVAKFSGQRHAARNAVLHGVFPHGSGFDRVLPKCGARRNERAE